MSMTTHFLIGLLMLLPTVVWGQERQVRPRPEQAAFVPTLQSVVDLTVTVNLAGLECRIREGRGIVRCAELEALLDNAVASELKLSEEIRQRLLRVSDRFSKEMQAISHGGGDQNRLVEESKLILDNARKESLELLHADQRRIFDGIVKRQNQMMFGWPLLLELAQRESELGFERIDKQAIKNTIEKANEIIEKETGELNRRFFDEIISQFGKKEQEKVSFILGDRIELRANSLEVLLAQIKSINRLKEFDLTNSLRFIGSYFRLATNGELQLAFGPPGNSIDLIQHLVNSSELNISPAHWQDLYSEGSPFSKIRERHEEKHQALWAEKDSMSTEKFTLAYEQSIQGFDDEMFEEFKSRLFPDQLEKLDRLLIRAEVLKLGLLASICYGRLGKELGVTQAEIKKCLEVGEQQTQALQKAIRELTLQVDDNFGKLLDDDQRSFLKERVGVFDTNTLLGSCPSLLVLPRK